jgi:DNA-binding winged helix-turn-helix (wHTH) protein/tetratricopeptide (TPR) repeat protein
MQQRHLALGPTSVDLTLLEVTRAGRTMLLTPKEGKLLSFLAEKAGHPVDRSALLTDVWGYRAGVESRTVLNTVRRVRVKIEVDPSEPRHLLTVKGAGYRLVVDKPRVPRKAPPGTPLLGRTRESARCIEALHEGGLVTLRGSGGFGKTRLALEVAAKVDPAACWIDLQERGVPEALALGLGLSPEGSVGDALSGRPGLLVVLDGAESQVGEVSRCVAEWRSEAPRTRFLVTSTLALDLRGERVIEVGPLPARIARRLFLDRVRERAGEHAAQAAGPVAQTIVDLLDRCALAIELAAARCRVLTASQLLERLDDRFAVLRGGYTDLPERHQALEVVIATSWDLLPADQQAALSQCVVFRDGFDLRAGEAILGPGALDQLDALVGRSVLRRSEGRLRVPRSVAAYVRQHAPPGPEAIERHARWYVALGEQLAGCRTGEASITARRRLLDEAGNLLAVVARLPGTWAGRALVALSEVLADRLPAEERIRLFGEATQRAEGALRTRLALAHALALLPTAPQLATSILAQLPESGERLMVEGFAAESAESADCFRRAQAAFADRGDRLQEGRAVGNLGRMLGLLGDRAGQVRRYRQALAIHREVDNRLNAANVVVNLALLAGLTPLEELRAQLEAALDVHTTSGSRHRAGIARGRLAQLAMHEGRRAEAEALLEAAEVTFRELGFQDGATHTLLLRSAAWMKEDRFRARSMLTPALDLVAGSPQRMSIIHRLLGQLSQLDGDAERARGHYERAAEMGVACDRVIARGLLAALDGDPARSHPHGEHDHNTTAILSALAGGPIDPLVVSTDMWFARLVREARPA